jgi:SAM-dependent methyltransferase
LSGGGERRWRCWRRLTGLGNRNFYVCVGLKNLFGSVLGPPDTSKLNFATDVESEALKLIKKGISPYDAINRARQSVSDRRHPGGEKPTFSEFSLIQKMLRRYDPSIVDRTLSPNETMKGENYFWVGTSAAEVIVKACMVSKLQHVSKVLDLPCGHGRVLRHLVRLFPDAEVDACDLDTSGVEFCASTFGARPIQSKEDLTAVKFETAYDLIWIGSLFTHTSYDLTKKWLTFLANLLSPQGIIVATFHGRWATRIQRLVPYIDEESWSKIMEEYESKGYGYHDYKREHTHNFISGSYGISVTKPHTIVGLLEGIPDTRIYMYQERAWGENHDVVVFGHPDWDEGYW